MSPTMGISASLADVTPSAPALEASEAGDFPDADADITDPPVPPSVLLPPPPAPPALPTTAADDAVLHAFCGRLQRWMLDYHATMMRTMDETMLAMRRWVETTIQANEHQGYQLANALEALAKHAPPAPGYPYAVQVLAQSPQGFAVTLTVQKPDAGELVAALDALLPWLKSTGYLAPEYPAMT